MEDLLALAENVKDRESFLDFVDALAADFAAEERIERSRPSVPYGPGALGWENGSIDSFLDACTAAVRDTLRNDAGESPLGEEASWSQFARFLLWGKHYE